MNDINDMKDMDDVLDMNDNDANNAVLPIPFHDDIVFAIRNKKELKALDDQFIAQKLKDFFSNISNYQYKEKVLLKLSSSKSFKSFSKSRECDFLIKTVRAELRKVYGAFILEDYNKKYALLKKIDKKSNSSDHEALLLLHKSTKERLPHYEALYEHIFKKIKGKVIVMDLACGLNPLSAVYFRDKIKKYFASDISSQDCEFIKKYFETVEIPNDVFQMDLADKSNYPRLNKVKCDVCFIFKALDGIERVERNITEDLLKSIDTKWFALTFPTLSLGGVREIKEFRRVWLEKLLDKLEWKWEKKLIENELVYMVEK